MGKNSKYYKDLRKIKTAKIKEIQKQIPLYTSAYIDSCIRNHKINTAYEYASDVLLFFQFLKDRNPKCKNLKTCDIPLDILEFLNAEDINEFQSYMKSDDGTSPHMVSDRTLARKMASMRSFFAYMAEKKFISDDPTLKADKNKKLVENDIKRLNTDEANRLIQAVKETKAATDRGSARSRNVSKRDLAIVTLFLNTGIRVSECVGMDVSDVDFVQNTIKIVRKGGKETHLYMNKIVQETMRDYLQNGRPLLTDDPKEKALFLSLKRNRMAVRSIEAMLKKFKTSAGISENVSPHTLRRTYGTTLYNKTGDIYMVADVLGHKDVNTTVKHYAAMDEEHKKSAAEVNLYDDE